MRSSRIRFLPYVPIIFQQLQTVVSGLAPKTKYKYG
jgi:hypothetical protein